MAKRQIILFLLIVCLPLAVLAWLGWRLARHEQQMVQQRFRGLVVGKLEETDRVVSAYFDRRQRELLELTEFEDHDPDHLRRIVREHPLIGQLFVLDPNGTLVHPNPAGPLNGAEREFLFHAKEVFLDRELVRGMRDENESAVPADHGWYVRYWGPGLQLIFYHRLPSGQVFGVLLERSRWVAELIAELPETAARAASGDGPEARPRVCLVDSNGRTVYQWGPFEPEAGAEPVVELPLSEPLGAWRMRYFVDRRQFTTVGRSAYFSLFGALALVGIGLVVVAVYFYREYARQVRDAVRRVNFVNQVSHELKTPLTSIRMYAELLEIDLDQLDADEAAPARGHLDVIVAESQRLSRLIGNVLTFARQRRNKLTLRRTTGRVDEVIARVIDRFRPAFAQGGIEVAFDGSADKPVRLDVDAVEQILGNLLSNVEKYAAAGGRVDVTSRQEGDCTTIEVADHGPGVPAALRERIFRPFYRISDRVEAGVGTGIGLSIARQLARIHGGDLVLLPSETGARFEVRLQTPAARDEAVP